MSSEHHHTDNIPMDNVQSEKAKEAEQSANNGHHPHPPAAAERQTSKDAERSLKNQKFRDRKARCQRACMAKPHLFLIFILSVLGFCYHFNIALVQYWSYTTTVTVANEEPKDFKINYPAATLCFQDVIPYYLMTDRFPDYKENVERIRAEMVRRNDSNFWNDKESASFIKIKGQTPEGGKRLLIQYTVVNNLNEFAKQATICTRFTSEWCTRTILY